MSILDVKWEGKEHFGDPKELVLSWTSRTFFVYDSGRLTGKHEDMQFNINWGGIGLNIHCCRPGLNHWSGPIGVSQPDLVNLSTMLDLFLGEYTDMARRWDK